MEKGHEFHAEHGFTGSAKPSKEFRPEVPGFKRGQNVHVKSSLPVGGSMDFAGGNPEAGAQPGMAFKEGGMPKGHKKNYKHGGRIEHDHHPKHESHHHTDKHGFQIHKGKKHKE